MLPTRLALAVRIEYDLLKLADIYDRRARESRAAALTSECADLLREMADWHDADARRVRATIEALQIQTHGDLLDELPTGNRP